MNDWIAIGLLVFLLAGNAFFVAAEFAIMSTRRAQIEPLAENGSLRAKKVLYALENVSLMLATCQLGITICSLLILNVSEPALHHLLEHPLAATGIPPVAVDVAAFSLTLILVTYLHVIFGEMVPKNAAVTLAARGIALWIVPSLMRVARIFAPVVALLNGMSNRVLAWVRVEPKDEVASTFTLGELQSIVAQSTAEGTVEDDAGVIGGALEFTEKSVSEIMVPREQVQTLTLGCTPAELEHAVARTGYSRFIVTDPEGSYMGYLHLKDALAVPPAREHIPFGWRLVRSMSVVAPETDIDDALAKCRVIIRIWRMWWGVMAGRWARSLWRMCLRNWWVKSRTPRRIGCGGCRQQAAHQTTNKELFIRVMACFSVVKNPFSARHN